MCPTSHSRLATGFRRSARLIPTPSRHVLDISLAYSRHVRILRNRQQIGPNTFQGSRADAVDPIQVFDILKGAVRFAIGNDLERERLAQAGELHHLGPVRAIDVDQIFGGQRFGAVDLDKLPAMAPPINPMAGEHDEATGHERKESPMLSPREPRLRGFGQGISRPIVQWGYLVDKTNNQM